MIRSPPTRFDIDRIVNERKSKPIEIPERRPADSLISTPRFPSANLGQIEEPTFRSEVIGDITTYSLHLMNRHIDAPPTFAVN